MAKNEDIEINRELLGILDKLLEEGRWDATLFLQASGKKIKDLRDEVHAFIDKIEQDENAEFHPTLGFGRESKDWLKSFTPIEKITSPVEVYVGLYQNEGMNIQKWGQSLDVLLARSSTRPIYANEEDIQKTLKLNTLRPNDAYVAIVIDKDDILDPGEKIPTDRYGHPLLLVKENALKKKNIKRFEHLTGSYELKNEQLVRKT